MAVSTLGGHLNRVLAPHRATYQYVTLDAAPHDNVAMQHRRATDSENGSIAPLSKRPLRGQSRRGRAPARAMGRNRPSSKIDGHWLGCARATFLHLCARLTQTSRCAPIS